MQIARIFLVMMSFALLLCSSHPAIAQPISAVHVGTPIDMFEGDGDTWDPTWMKDGSIVTPSDDTDGFRKAGLQNLSFNRLDGDDVRNLHGETINLMTDYGKRGEVWDDGCSWKSSGCYAIDGTIYWVVARHIYGGNTGDPMKRQTAQNACIIKSTDGGKTWTPQMSRNYNHPTFPARRFATPYFIQYGQDGAASVDHADKYVYATSNNGFWDNGDSVILGRVLRSKIGDLHGSDWEYYRGGDGMSDKAWQPQMRFGKHLIDSLGKLGMAGAVYIPGIKRYILIEWYYPDGSGSLPKSAAHTIWDFYQSPKPWGPWAKFGTKDFQPEGYYSPRILQKFTSADGLSLYALTAGDFISKKYYHTTVVPFQVELADKP